MDSTSEHEHEPIVHLDAHIVAPLLPSPGEVQDGVCRELRPADQLTMRIPAVTCPLCLVNLSTHVLNRYAWLMVDQALIRQASSC